MPLAVSPITFARYLAASAIGDHTITVLPGANHQIMTGDNYHPQYLAAMVEWVASRFAGDQMRMTR